MRPWPHGLGAARGGEAAPLYGVPASEYSERSERAERDVDRPYAEEEEGAAGVCAPYAEFGVYIASPRWGGSTKNYNLKIPLQRQPPTVIKVHFR